MREMRKFLLAFCVVCLTVSAATATVQRAAFSVHCKHPGDIECQISGDQSAIQRIDNCRTPASWKPPAGKAYLISWNADDRLDCLEKTRLRCDRSLIWLYDARTNHQQILLSCKDETSFEIIYDSTETQSSYILQSLDWSYEKKLCLGTSGTFNDSTGQCTCNSGQTGYTENGCMCNYGGLIYPGLGAVQTSLDWQDISVANASRNGRIGNCASSLVSACTGTGGHYKNEDTLLCECPSNLNLKLTETNTACICKPGFIWQNPLNKQLGCVEKNKTITINATVVAADNTPIANCAIKYYDTTGASRQITTDSTGHANLENVSNTSYISIAHNGYAPTTISIQLLTSNPRITLQPVAADRMADYYHGCMLQPEDTTRSQSGLQAQKANGNTKWLYCGPSVSEKDCAYDDVAVGIDNRIYRCSLDNQVGKWIPLEVSSFPDIHEPRGLKDTAMFSENRGDRILAESEQKIIGYTYSNPVLLSDGQTHSTSKINGGLVAYVNLSECVPNDNGRNGNVCRQLATMPKWGVMGSTPVSDQTTDDQTTNTTSQDDCTTSGGTLDEAGKCQCGDGLKPSADATKCESADDNGVITGEINTNNANNTNTINNKTTTDAERAAKIKEAEEAYKKAKENEQSLANRTLGAASTAATGLGLMNAAAAYSEQKADEAAEQDMSAYLETFRCEYGKGQTTKASNEEITLPGGNDLLTYYTEYKNIADALKATKKALGMRPGIEEEVVYDRAETGLYQYSSVGKTGGAYTSLANALTDTEGEDAAAWAAQKDETSKKLKGGGIAAGAGVAGGVLGNTAINTDTFKNMFNSSEE